MNIHERLKSEFNGRISFREKRPGVLQVLAPLFHEDGDMVDIFLDMPKEANDPIRISDHGMSLMRLSYTYEVDTPTKRKVLARILAENSVSETSGRLFLETSATNLYPALMQFAQTVAKVSSMQMFKREVIQSLFYESLDDFVTSVLATYHPQPHYTPVSSRDDLDVDWLFRLPTRDIFLFGVKDTAKARLAGLTCLEYQKMFIPFRSVIIHEDFENGLSKKDQRRITNIADKQFTSLSDFQAGGESYFAREAQSLTVQ